MGPGDHFTLWCGFLDEERQEITLTEGHSIVLTLEYTDAAGLRWTRRGSDPPERQLNA